MLLINEGINKEMNRCFINDLKCLNCGINLLTFMSVYFFNKLLISFLCLFLLVLTLTRLVLLLGLRQHTKYSHSYEYYVDEYLQNENANWYLHFHLLFVSDFVSYFTLINYGFQSKIHAYFGFQQRGQTMSLLIGAVYFEFFFAMDLRVGLMT